jgi:toxin YoeB
VKIVFVDESWEDYLHWQQTDKKRLNRINDLLKDIYRTPFEGIGKPEAQVRRILVKEGRWRASIDL